MNMTDSEQSDVLQIVSGILHLGNIIFSEVGTSDAAQIDNEERKNILSAILSIILNVCR